MAGFVAAALILILVSCITQAVHRFWWKPKRLEKHLRRNGIDGSSYKLFQGELEETKKLIAQAWSKPMPLNHSIVARVNPTCDKMVREYGRVCFSWRGRTPQLLVADAGLMKFVLTDKDGNFGIPPPDPFVDILSRGLTTLEGDLWAKRRKLISPAFHHDKIQGMVPKFLTSCCDLIERWKSMAVDSHGKFELDIATEMQNLSADIIARAAFGTSFENTRKIFELQKEQAVLVFEALLSEYLPGSRFLPTKKNRRRYEIDGKIKKMLREMILSKERAMDSGKHEDDDLLSLMLQCKNQSRSNMMTMEDVIEECKLFYFAGQETTSNWLTWAMILLSMHPNWQEKAREEVLRVFGKRTPDVKSLNQLKLVSMVLQEVLRLYPPVTGQFRYTLQTTRLGDAVIPSGVEVILPTVLLHHNPECWGEDVEEFKPERFVEGVLKAAKDDRTAFLPFGWGPRFCIGQNFATIEVKLAITMILQHFSFELSPSYVHAPHTIITLQPQYGAPLILCNI